MSKHLRLLNMHRSNHTLRRLGACVAQILVILILACSLVAANVPPASAALAVPAASSQLEDTAVFTFASMGDAQAEAGNFTNTVNQISSLNPSLVLFNGDMENDGVTTTGLNTMVGVLKNANLFNRTFMVRGNHDDHVSGSAAIWENYFETAPNIKTLPTGVSNYVSLNSSSDTLNYSFIYENSMFIGLDVPGDPDLLTTTQLNWLDARLTYAESQGLTHAFIFFHGPLYCVESVHCMCSSRTDARCTPTGLVTVINKHPIVSATFHGHEHILGWTHMDNTRLAGLTGTFEQFITSPSGGWTYNSYVNPARMDYYYPNMGSSQGFATVTVNGSSFTYAIYKVGTSTPVWTQTFTKGGSETVTTYTISGNAGVAEAVLSYVDGAVKTVTANGSGDYALSVSENWSGTVTPFKAGYTFTPLNRAYTNVNADQPDQNYTASTSIIYYVDNTNPACSNAGPGSSAQPFCTIAKGADVAVTPGTTVMVVAGTYAETVFIEHSGTEGKPITFKANPGVTVTGNPTGFGSAFAISSRSYIVIDGFIITNTPYKGIYVDASNHITISNNHVSYAGATSATYPFEQGIYLRNTTYSTITGNITDHNTSIGIRLVTSGYNLISNNISYSNYSLVETDAAGIELTGSSHNTVINNITYSNEDSGINVYILDGGPASTYNLVIGNLSYANGDHGIDANNSPYNTFIGNTVHGNGTVGINVEGAPNTGSHHTTIYNNISAGNGFTPPTVSFGGNLRVDTASVPGTVSDYNLLDRQSANVQIIWDNVNYFSLAAFQAAVPNQEVHGLEGDPLFVDPVPPVQRQDDKPFQGAELVGDYNLNPGSPAIDSAYSDAPNQPLYDLSGNVRIDDPATVDTGAGVRTYDDRGAYEFLPSGPSLPIVTTQAVTAIATTTATGNGTIAAPGAPNPTQHGVVWSTSANPTIADNKTMEGPVSSAGAFTSAITGLTPGTLYHVRAYATNDVGTVYGEDVTFRTLLTPTVTTQAVTNITATTATGNGNITALGVPNPTEHGVVWSTSANPTIADNKTTDGPVSATGAFTSNITGLTPGTLYHVRAYATNLAGTVYGDEVTFTTLLLPSVTTQAVTDITQDTATGNGNITALGMPNPTQHGFVWSTTENPTTANSKTMNGPVSETGAFTGSITGLTPGTRYYVRAYATNAAGTVYGENIVFTTLLGPSVTTQPVTDITTTSATGNGNITTLGTSNPTEHGVVWSTSTNPTIADNKTMEGPVSETGAFTSSITGLTPGTQYHVRAYATNAAGTSYGSDVTFTTLIAPTVTTQPVTNIGTTTATANGSITALGVPNPTEHGFVWSISANPTIADSKTTNGPASATGAFTGNITGLVMGMQYHVRAYATNAVGTVYGEDVVFTTLPSTTSTTTPATNAGTGTDVSGVGTATWLNTGYITADDTSYSMVTLNNATSHYLQGTNYGFAIPANADINGFAVTIGRYESGTGAGNDVRDSVVRLLKDGVVTGTNKAATATEWPIGAPVAATYGANNDLWGTTWTPADINASNFGVALSATSTNNRIAYVDYMQISVTYTVTVGSSTTAVSCGGGTPVVDYGSELTCVATVVRGSGSKTPTGEVSWTSTGSGSFSASPCVLSGVDGTTSCSVTYIPTKVGSGSHEITAVYAGDSNFFSSTGSQVVTVNKKAASVTPDDAGKTYGDPDPILTGTLTGFLPADNVTAVYSRTEGETVEGSPYTISAVLSPVDVLDNYDITYNTASFTITPPLEEYTLTINKVGYGTVTVTPSLEHYHYGDVVTLTAIPDPGWSFFNWSANVVDGKVTILGNTNVTAMFTQDEYTLTIDKVGSGNVVLDPPKTTYHYGDVVDLIAMPAVGWSFGSWSANVVDNSITITGNTTVTATFIQNEYTLTVETTGSGAVTKDPDQATYHYGDVVTLTAVPEPGWSFGNWSENVVDGAVTISGDTTVTATFTQNEYSLTIETTGSGAVTKDPDQATYHYGDVVTLTATPEPGWDFGSWSENVVNGTVTITGNTTVTATFTQDEYTLTFEITGSGAVTKDPDQATYHYGDVVTLTAVPEPGWSFGSWSENVVDGSVTISGNTTVAVTFTQDEYSLTIETTGSGTVSKAPDKPTYHYGDVVTLTATPEAGWSFGSWSANVVDGSVTITGDITVTATFTQDEYVLTIDKVGSGVVTKDPDQATYHYGDVVALTAAPEVGWSFGGWSENVVDGSVTITGNITVTATFTQNEYVLTIETTGNGTVSKDPDKASYHYGDVVDLTATPELGWSFGGWSENVVDGTVTISGDTTVTATFNQDEYTLTINKVGSGTVTIAPEQPVYHYGDSVQLTAAADEGWRFSGWSGDLTGIETQQNVSMTGNKTITATFSELSVPTVTTQAVTAITTTTATGNGSITHLGIPNATQHGVVWGTAVNPTVNLPTKTEQGVPAGTGAFTSSITGLTPGTLYHVRAYATNDAGTSYGEDVTFTTWIAPTVTTQAVTGIGATAATGNGNITALGVPNPTEHGFVWATTPNPTIANNKTTDGPVSATGAFTSTISDLLPSTLYHVRAYATNAAGTSYGNDVTFTTAPATTVTFTSSGSWTVPAGVTSITVEVWGGGGKGGSVSGTGERLGGGGGGGAYSKAIINVTPGTSYPYVVGAGATGTGAGGDTYFINASTVMAKGGNSVANNATNGASGGSASAGVGTTKYSGGNGANGSGSANYGGGGGSSAGTASNGTNATNQNGANAPTGGGNGGNGRSGTSGSGSAGQAPGGGGGGAYKSSSGSSAQNGGNGARGQIRITYYVEVKSTTTSVSCGAGTPEVTYGSSLSCVATVTASSGTLSPSGTVSWTTNGSGSITTSPCTLTGTGGTASCSITYTPSAVGTGSHLIRASYAGNANFVASNGSQVVTVNKKAASVTPNEAGKIYGEADPALTGTLVGFLPADNVTATYSRAPGETVAGGPYSISAELSPAGVLPNYDITYNTADFTINKKDAAVTPDDATKTFGEADPPLTGALVGFLPADNVTAIYSRVEGETVEGSPYTISATLSPVEILGNYNITYNTASFTITPRPEEYTLTIEKVGNGTVTVDPSQATYRAGDVVHLTATPDPGWSFSSWSENVVDGSVTITGDTTVTATFTEIINAAPSFTSEPVTTVDEDAVYTYNITTTDPDDGATLTISAPTRPEWLTFTDNGDGTATLTGVPTNAEVGSHDVVLQVTDGMLTVDQAFSITVANTNDAPFFTSTPVTEAAEDAVYTYNITVSDPDAGAVISISAPEKPEWLTLTDNGDGTATLTGTPGNGDVGINRVTLRASDGSVEVDQVFTIDVGNANDGPAFTSEPVTSVDEDEVYTYNITTTHPDAGAALIISAPTLPAWLTLTDNGDGTATLTGTPGNSEVGEHSVALQVSDGVELASQLFTITVANTNDAPELAQPADQNNTLGDVVNLQLSATAIDAGSMLTYSADGLPGGLSIDPASGLISGTLTGEAGVYQVTVSVDDGNGGTDNKQFNWTVTEPAGTYTLTVIKVGNGTVTADKDGPYPLNEVVELTAVADEGWTFSAWDGCSGTGNTCSVTMDGDKTVTATFTQVTQTTLTAGTHDDTHDAWNYSGDWLTMESVGAFADTLHYSVASGNETLVTFNGRQINLIYLASPISGSMNVYIDGVKAATINQYNDYWEWQKTWTSDLLPDGDHTLRLVPVSGDFTTIDAITVISTPVVLSTGTYDNADPAIHYEGRWFTLENVTGPYADTLRYSATAGNNTQLNFNGRQFKLTYLASPNSGIVDIYLDGVKIKTIDQRSDYWEWQKTWTSDLLPGGDHSLRVVHVSGELASIDAITVAAIPTVLSTGTYDNEDPAINYEGIWFALEDVTGPYSGSLRYSTTTGNESQVNFNGRQIKLSYLASPYSGTIDVYLDGVKLTTINQNSPNWEWQKTWTSDLLPAGDHSLRVVHVSGELASIDAITVMASPIILSAGTHDDANNAFSYEGSWLTMEAVPGPYADTLHYSYGMGEAVQVAFNGTQVVLTYLAAPSAGLMDVYIDGVKVITIDQKSETWDWQETWTSELLAAGDHSLRIVHASEGSSSFGNVDSITVIP